MKFLLIVYLFRQLFCRGKHRTVQQDAIFLKFMQSHKDSCAFDPMSVNHHDLIITYVYQVNCT